MRRVVFFSDRAGAKPEFRWLAVKDIGEPGEPSEWPDWKSILGGNLTPSMFAFNENRIIHAKLDTSITMMYDDNFMYDYDDQNPAVIAATNRKTMRAWRGPIFAFSTKMNEDFSDIAGIGDMDLHQYTDLVAWLIYHGNTSTAHELRTGTKVQGAMMHCSSEQSEAKIETIMVPRMHPIFEVEHGAEVCGISENIGMPLLLRKDRKTPKFIGELHRPADPSHSNSTLTAMMTSCDPDGPHQMNFGLTPRHWQGGQVPDTLIVRQDREDLDPHVLQAFGDYCEVVLQPGFKRTAWPWKEAFASLAAEVLENMESEKWSSYLATWKSLREEVRPDPMQVDPQAAAPEGRSLRSQSKRKSVHFTDNDVYAGEMEPAGVDGKKQRVVYQRPTGYDEDDEEPDVKPKVEPFDAEMDGTMKVEDVDEGSDANMKMEPSEDNDEMDTT
ncbi:unnamed protein product [Zymoseptoria tritici ST99CH_1E4]|nr:unnamed protein product [Zymoseptoria tritici ST99CH_1E4]